MRKELSEMWHKAWPDSGAFVRASAEDLERFAELVRADERERWDDVKNYLIAARDGSMSRDNSEALAGELLQQLERNKITQASTSLHSQPTSSP